MKSNQVITNLEQVTPEWLTAVLTQSGALIEGEVIDFEANDGSGHWSQNAQLTITYSNQALGECPTRLFLKLVDTDTGDGEFFLPSEVTYYTQDYIDLPDAPLVRCYDGAYDAAQNRYHLLLSDKSETHIAAYDLLPSLAHGQAVAEALATLHAHWWGNERLKQIGATFHNAAHIRRFVEIGTPGIPYVQSIFGRRLEPHWSELIQKLFAMLPDALAIRSQDSTHFTLLHGDPNPGNLLVPKVGERPLYLIDQQPFDWSLTTWLGVYDLAYVMALYWRNALRRELEIPVLRHYHQTLTTRGVKNYAWEQLYNDYRLSVALMVPIAVEYMRDGGDPDWNEFRFGLVQRTLTACDDLDSWQLLLSSSQLR
ncbi:MAG: aminoglycoside phosphotransferase family protein [Chloroflexi bacterium]|nr:MAG: aminoglycoside phosphotransferase family protein [Chloroflexota bacterium]